MQRWELITAVLCGLSAGSLSAATVYKCRVADGPDRYQGSPCTGPGESVVIQTQGVVDHADADQPPPPDRAARQARGDQARLTMGMSASKVRDKVGAPSTIKGDGDRHRWVYNAPDGRTRTLIFENGKLAGSR